MMLNGVTFWRIGPIARLSMGLAALLITLVLVADMMLGVVPARGEIQRETRHRIAENLVIQFSALLEANNLGDLGKSIQQVLARDPEIRSITIRRSDGLMVMHRGQPLPSAGAAPAEAESPGDHLTIPIHAGRTEWGQVDLRFVPAAPGSWLSWLAQPGVLMIIVLGVGGYLLCYAYLRRAMHYLNPSASVPDRVRKAFDSLAEGLVIVDQRARIVLANRMFRQLHPSAAGELNGRPIEALDWLAPRDGTAAAWTTTLQSGKPVLGVPLVLAQPEGESTQLLVSSAPITDNSGRARGCLITFDNVTAVHQANAELRTALDALEASRARIEEQNDELRRLASLDSLTGCFNRRALYEFASDIFAYSMTARQQLCCVMVDIDHFKQFNDLYGHAVGDQVIQVVARALTADLRETDMLGRYGGEEFCIVMPATSTSQALAVAERMRQHIEAGASAGVEGADVMPITASFGVASLSLAAQSIEGLIDQADQALYEAKQAGRNRVTLWRSSQASFTRPAELSAN